MSRQGHLHCVMFCSRFQDVKEYADELEMVFRALLDVREVSPAHTVGIHARE